MPRLHPERQRTETAATEKDIEAGRPEVGPSTPTKNNNSDIQLRLVPTVESPESQDDDSTLDDRDPRTRRQRYNHNISMSIASEDDYVAKFMKHRKNNMSSPSDKSGSMADSVYLDASYNYNDQSTSLAEEPEAETSDNDNYSTKFNAAYNDDITLDYSMDTMENNNNNNNNKESFSSYARPNTTMTSNNMVDDPTCVEDTNKCSISLFSKYNDSTLVSHLEEEEESRVEEDSDLSAEPAGTSGQSYSPLGRRNVTFSSQLLEDSCLDCSRDLVLQQSEDSIRADTHQKSQLRTKPKMTIVTKKSILGSFSDDEIDDDDDNDLFDSTNIMTKETVTPAYTVSTAGLWSPSSDASSVVPPSEGPSDESFGNDSDVVRVEVEGLDMSNEDEDTSHNVHVCKSAGCSACRHPQHASPTFVSAKQGSTGYNPALRPRAPPRRWWMDDSKLRGYISNALLPSPQHRREVGLSGVTDEKPFDEP